MDNIGVVEQFLVAQNPCPDGPFSRTRNAINFDSGYSFIFRQLFVVPLGNNRNLMIMRQNSGYVGNVFFHASYVGRIIPAKEQNLHKLDYS